MRYDDDIEIDPSFREVREAREREEAEAERIRRISREVLREQQFKTEEELAEEELAEQERLQAEQEEREREERRQNSWWRKLWRGLFTGEILTDKEISHFYPYLFCVAGMFLLSMIVLFSALRLDIKRTRLQNELKVLREQSVRQSELLYQATSRGAIIEQSKARGLNLEELPTQTYIIDNE